MAPWKKDHGRIETGRHVWVGMVERQREIKGKVSVEYPFYIGFKSIASAQALAEAARGHRGIENRLHWVLDSQYPKRSLRSCRKTADRLTDCK